MSQTTAVRAVLHLLKLIQRDSRLGWLIGPGSQSYDLITQAAAEAAGEPLVEFMAKQPALAFLAWPDVGELQAQIEALKAQIEALSANRDRLLLDLAAALKDRDEAHRKMGFMARGQLEVLEIRVRYSSGAHQTNTVKGKRASSTSSYEEAARMLARKLYESAAYTLTLVHRECAVEVYRLEVFL
ncbi:MAG: hypothetical protein E6Q67_05165 [Roseateles sp.]|nr:MAG: hypothetical protein E6Q67_05165 [Roseateles sp.]